MATRVWKHTCAMSSRRRSLRGSQFRHSGFPAHENLGVPRSSPLSRPEVFSATHVTGRTLVPPFPAVLSRSGSPDARVHWLLCMVSTDSLRLDTHNTSTYRVRNV